MTIVKGLQRCDIFLELSTQKILNVMAYFSSSNPKGMPITVVTTCNILVGNFYFIFCGGIMMFDSLMLRCYPLICIMNICKKNLYKSNKNWCYQRRLGNLISTYKRLNAVIVWSWLFFIKASLLMVDCWIECCNSGHLLKYQGCDWRAKKRATRFFLV